MNMAISAATQPKALWVEQPDGVVENLMWGHIRVGQISRSSVGTYYAYFTDGMGYHTCLRDYDSPREARAATEEALANASI